MTIFPQKNLSVKEQPHFIKKQRSTNFHGLQEYSCFFIYDGCSVFFQKPFLTAAIVSDFVNVLLSANMAGTAKRKGRSAAEHIFF